MEASKVASQRTLEELPREVSQEVSHSTLEELPQEAPLGDLPKEALPRGALQNTPTRTFQNTPGDS